MRALLLGLTTASMFSLTSADAHTMARHQVAFPLDSLSAKTTSRGLEVRYAVDASGLDELRMMAPVMQVRARDSRTGREQNFRANLRQSAGVMAFPVALNPDATVEVRVSGNCGDEEIGWMQIHDLEMASVSLHVSPEPAHNDHVPRSGYEAYSNSAYRW